MHPSGELGSPFEAVDAPHQGDERLLGGIQGIGLVAGQPPAQGVDLVVVPLKQGVERDLVALLALRTSSVSSAALLML